MTLVERIDDIYSKMENNRLSTILPLVYNISIECQDYKGFCILQFWGRPIADDSKANLTINSDLANSLFLAGFTHENAQKIVSDSLEEYISLRTIEKDKVMAFSVKELEDKLDSFDELFKSISVPQNLHPTDLYFRSKEVEKTKASIIVERQIIEKQYAILQSYISLKLSNYRQIATKKERKEIMKKSIRNSKDVFIIHGHDEAKRLELEQILKGEFDLNPIVLKNKPNQGLTIIDKFEKYAKQCSYAFALFTPDDIIVDGKTQYFQVRPNVIFELGWFYANLGRNRVCILEKESEKNEVFSDLQGILRIQFKNSVSESYLSIKRELESVGII